MEIKRVEPKVVTYKITLDKTDKEYSSCTWAKFSFDLENRRLSINSDVGDYFHSWRHSGQDDFMYFMGQLYAGNLISKISYRDVFLLERSKEQTLANIKAYGLEYYCIENEDALQYVINEINHIDASANEDTFINKVCSLIPGIDFEAIQPAKDYPAGAKIVVELFVKYVQPRIREEFGGEIPNKETMEAIQEVKKMKADPSIGKSYTDVDQMMEELLNDV